jgi:release factor glutamine methyltransferase
MPAPSARWEPDRIVVSKPNYERSLAERGTLMLARAGVEEPRSDAWALVEHAAAAAANPPAVEDLAMALLQRRAAREPLAYILGHSRFCGLDLLIDDRVLVPTEHRTGTLVTTAIDLPQRARVHEVGTGCGAVALAVKSKRPDLIVSASDISAPAVEVARTNAQRLGLEISVTVADGLPQGQFDLVLANLPYTDSAQATQQLAPEEASFQPGVALFAGDDSLELIKKLIAQAPARMRLALEHGPHHTTELHRLLREARTLRDVRGDERVTIGVVPPLP